MATVAAMAPDSIDGPGVWPQVMATLVAGDDLPPPVAAAALGDVLDGTAGDARLAALLVGMAAKGVTAAELTAMVDAMVAAAVPLELADPASTIDIVGTGGSPSRRQAALNVSTMACFVAAAAGATVCKHGNRKASSTSGSSDLLEALGITVELDGPAVRRCVDEVGLGFAYARAFHPAMRHAAGVRAALGIPTVFNLLGPLSHPAGVNRVVLGVGDPTMAPLMVEVLRRRQSPAALVVCGHDGTDELVTTGPTRVHELRNGEVSIYDLQPADVGIDVADPVDVRGGTPERNAELATAVLSGGDGPVADVVALNAAAGLLVAGVAPELSDGVDLARRAMADGSALARLGALAALTGQMAV